MIIKIYLAGAFTSTITKVSVTLLSLDARPHHFAFKRSGTAQPREPMALMRCTPRMVFGRT